MLEPLLIRVRQPRKDLTGERFGKLVVIGWATKSRWLCECDCGNRTEVLTANLNRHNTESCGCIRNIKSSKRATKHGLYHTPAYRTWEGVKRRCLDEKHGGRAYQEYGARGVTMDPGWAADPVAFVTAVGQPPSPAHSLDRIDNEQGYVPGNVRWATPLEQGSNKRNNRWVTFQGQRYTLAQLCRKIAEECELEPSYFRKAFEKVIYKKT